MKKTLLFFIFAVFISSIAAHSNNMYGTYESHTDSDELRYQDYKDVFEITPDSKFPEYYVNDPDKNKRVHLYGYINSTYTHEDNPYYYTQDSLNIIGQEKEDNYSVHKLYLVNVIECTDDMVWHTAFNGTVRFYEKYKELDDAYFDIQTGPTFLLKDYDTKISSKITYGTELDSYQRAYESIGGLLKLNYFGLNNFNSTLHYSLEKRNYKSDNTYETNRYVNSLFLVNKYILSKKHIFKFVPTYQNHQTAKSYQDKDVYGAILGYMYFPKSIDLYFGGGYELLRTSFKDSEPGKDYKKKVTDNKYSLYVGYNFFDNLNLQFSYSNEKIYTNQPNVDTASYNNSLSLSVTYKFHIM